MKCIRCEKDSKYKDRPGRTCPGCKGTFAFEPKDGDPVTDMLFKNAIEAVSGGGKVRWGVEHLYYEVCRRKKPWRAPIAVLFAFAAFASFLFGIALFLPSFKGREPVALVGLGVTVVGLMIAATRFRGPFVGVDPQAFRKMWDRWNVVHGEPGGVITRAPEQELPKDLEADIGDYSFDRAVICDRARTVDLLVANNFHFENNCAILGVGGYPKGPFEMIRKMLRNNPKLQVFVLHDATVAGCRLAHKLVTDKGWFGGSGLRVIDLGLRPRHAGPFRGLLQPGGGILLSDEDGIREDEAKWLVGHTLELAAARPEQVLKRLFAGLQAHANDDPRQRDTSSQGDSGGFVTYCGAFDAGGYGGDGDAGAMADGGADAFG